VADPQSKSSAISPGQPQIPAAHSAYQPTADEKSAIALLEEDAGHTSDAVSGQSAACREDRSQNPWRLLQWLRTAADFVVETRFARRRSRALLGAWQQIIQSGASQLSDRDVYARVVVEVGFSPDEAQGVLLRAEQSFCQWPADHELRFRDVVQYLVVTEYLRTHKASLGTHTNMTSVVARMVPETL
jgi:hypothetical protein